MVHCACCCLRLRTSWLLLFKPTLYKRRLYQLLRRFKIKVTTQEGDSGLFVNQYYSISKTLALFYSTTSVLFSPNEGQWSGPDGDDYDDVCTGS